MPDAEQKLQLPTRSTNARSVLPVEAIPAAQRSGSLLSKQINILVHLLGDE
jgi:hypothetical protein